MTAQAVLAICGSNLTGDVPFSCALAIGDRVTAARSAPGVRGDLVVLVQQLCREAGIGPEQLGGLRVDVGPGSYTGLRVAVTFVRFLQQFGTLPVAAIDSLALLAARAAAQGPAAVRVLLDARRERVHVQDFAVAPGRIVATTAPAAVPLADVLARLRAGDVVVVPATLPPAIAEPLRQAGAELRLERDLVAAEMFAPGLPFAPAASAELEPRYLMASYAED
jgi:tRNA threonylcarbamoyl adenosine modification protein YeaZ